MRDYVWQLKVEYPVEAYYEHPYMGRTLDPSWEPENWEANDEYQDRFGTAQFIWPSVRRYYLSRSCAVERANLLERYGARVRLMRSQAMEFEERDYKHAYRPQLKVVAS